MRVVHFIDSLAPGGAERSLAEITPDLLRLGLELEVVVLQDRPGFAEEVRTAGAAVVPLGEGHRMAQVRRATTLLRSERPDLVHTTLFEADIVGRTAARLARVPVVSSLVNTPYGVEHHSEAGLRPWRLRAAQVADMTTARLVRRFRAVSEAVKEAYVERLRLRADLVEVIPEGRSPSRLGRATPERRAAARADLQVNGTPVVLALGRIEPQKGFDALVRAVPAVRAAFPAVQVLVAGRPGRASTELTSLIAELGLEQSVRLLGHRDDALELLCAADVFVLPSRREGIPGVLQEAMALEAPVVASDIGPVREALGGGELAELVQPGDATGLAQALVRVLRDPDAYKERTHRARQRFLTEFDASTVATRILSFYESALAGTGRGGS